MNRPARPGRAPGSQRQGRGNGWAAADPWPPRVLAALACLILLLVVRPGFAQLAWQVNRSPVVDRILMLAPREYQQQLQQASEAIEREQYSEAIQALAQLLEPRPDTADGETGVLEDFFVGRPGDAHLVSSLRTEARRLLGRLPARGKELYRLHYGAEAQQRLDRALSERDEEMLAEVAWRYFHTEAGYQANLLLGQHHLDQGRPLAAAMCFARLAETPDARSRFDPELSLLLASSWHQAGNRERARDTLQQLRERLPGARFEIAGKTINLFGEGQDPITWLERYLPAPLGNVPELTGDWQMHRGVPSRNPTSAGGAPLMRYRWRVPVASTPDDEDLIRSLVMEQREQGHASIPSVMPLVIDDVVLMRTPENLLAVDFVTGKRIWEYPWADPPLTTLTHEEGPARNRQQRRHQLEERLWLDSTYGQLSSDGRCVFLVDDLSYIGAGATDLTMRMLRNLPITTPDQPQEYNSLVALELGTQGKYRWRVGGPTGEDEPALARAFFLGAPLVLADSLYVLAEVRGDVSLYVLDAGSGRLRWSQQLAHVGLMDIMQDPTRRLAGATPSYADGVLVCPTSAGGIVAVDIPTRSLLWGYQYPHSLSIAHANVRLNLARMRSGMPRSSEDSWLDSSALIADGRVIITPVEADEMLCLDLLTGKPLWSMPRGEDLLMVACVHQGQVIVVGESKIVTLSLDDGKTQWELPLSDPTDPAAPVGRPSGKGFLSNHRYYLPTTRRLLVIDLSGGRLETAIDLAEPLGTLVPYGDQIVSLSPEALTTYHQIDRLQQAVEQRLAAKPDDPWASEHQGLLQLERGDRLGALTSLRRAFHAYEPDDDRREGTRVLLVETLLAVLEQENNAATDEVIREVDALIERPLQRERYLRLIGKRMLREGKATDAFASFLELARQQHVAAFSSTGDGQLPLAETGNRNHLVRRDRFVRSGIREALRLADDDERADLDRRIVEQRDTALKADQIDALHGFLRIFAEHPSAAPVRLELARRYLEVGELLRVEQLVSPLLHAEPSPEVGRAWVLLARTMQSGGRTEMREPCLEALTTHWSDVPLQDGKTGAEWARDLRGSDDSSRPLAGIAAWPEGKVEVERLRGNVGNLPAGFQPYTNFRAIDLLSAEGPFPTRMRVAHDTTGTNHIVVNDGLGRERLRIPGASGRPRQFVDGTLSAKSLGHLIVINFGHGVLAANALNSPGNEQAVLWPNNYAELIESVELRQRQVRSRDERNAWGDVRVDVDGRRVHAIGPVEYEGVIYLQGNSLYCVDPLQGEPLWVRHDLAAGSRIWGDSEVVLVTPPGAQPNVPARVFRFMDGEELEPVAVPSLERTWSTLGRMVLTWDEAQVEGKAVWRLRLFDPWQQTDVWQRDCLPQTRGDLTAEGELALVSPDHRFVLLNAEGGEVVMEHELVASDRVPMSVYLRSSSDQALLVRSFEPRATEDAMIESFPDRAHSPLIDGDIYAFHRPSGQPQWPAPAVIESYGMPLDQPDDVPVLAFIRQVARSNPRSRRPTLALICIDKRDGRLLLEESRLNSNYGSFFMSGDSQERTVSVRLLNTYNYRLTFTDEPRQPEPPAQTDSSARRGSAEWMSKVMGATLQGVGRLLGGLGDSKAAPADAAAEEQPDADSPADDDAK